jgi:hypothetical protein
LPVVLSLYLACGGWVCRKEGLERPWNAIKAGVVIAVAGIALAAVFWQLFGSANFYPIIGVVALIYGTWQRGTVA